MPSDSREAVARGVLLGVAGFLPLSPTEAHLGALDLRDIAEIESRWLEHGAPWRDDILSPTAWNRARVRPVNHPVPRLLAAAGLLAAASARGGTLATILGVMLERTDAVEALQALTGSKDRPGIGGDRAIDMLASGIIPLALALAAHTGDLDLADAASSQWEQPACSESERGDAARAAPGCRSVTSGQNRCPRGAGSDPSRHSPLPTTSLLRMSDRGCRALCQRLSFPHS